MHNFNNRLSGVYAATALDRNLFTSDGRYIAREVILVPDSEAYSHYNAAKLLAVLTFPDDLKKRKIFMDFTGAKLAKFNISKNSPKRQKWQKLIAIPNKRIDEFLSGGKKSALYRLNMRMRAADVLWRKLGSSGNTFHQDSLLKVLEPIAGHHTRENPGFYSEFGNEAESFIKRILWPAKPVIHLAMGLYSQLSTIGLKDPSIIDLVVASDEWLVETMVMAETLRISYGVLFPHADSTYLKSRNKNFTVNLDETIAFLPTVTEIKKDNSEQLFF